MELEDIMKLEKTIEDECLICNTRCGVVNVLICEKCSKGYHLKCINGRTNFNCLLCNTTIILFVI